MVGRCIPYWNGNFLGDMLVFRDVPFSDDHLFTIQALGADVALTSVITARVVAYDLITVPWPEGGGVWV